MWGVAIQTPNLFKVLKYIIFRLPKQKPLYMITGKYFPSRITYLYLLSI